MEKGRKTAVLQGLRARIHRLERLEDGGRAQTPRALPFDLAPLDACWPDGGLPIAALHEVAGTAGAAGFAAATAFTAAIAARLGKTVLWCAAAHELYAPGLAAVGLHPARLLLAHAKAESDVLALMEEGLRHSALSCVIGEIAKLDLTASRRLQLAGEKSGVMALVLRKPGSDQSIPITCASRWRVGPFPSAPHVIPQAGRARWRLELLRARSGHSGCWIVEAPDAKGDLGFSGQLADRGADTPRAKFSLAG